MVKIRIVVQENHPRQKTTIPIHIYCSEFKPRFVLMWICHLMFLAPIEPISQVFNLDKGKAGAP
jgi:hypothetical protein